MHMSPVNTRLTMDALATDPLPCPFCGEELVKHSDHHGEWMAHQNEAGRCVASVTQLFDDSDVEEWNRRAPAAPSKALDAWIEREFRGHGRAIRAETDEPFPDEPYMSMGDAKELTRRAVATFALPANPKSTRDENLLTFVWKDGRQVTGTLDEFCESLEHHAEYAAGRLSHFSDLTSQLSGLLKQSAEIIRALKSRPADGDTTQGGE